MAAMPIHRLDLEEHAKAMIPFATKTGAPPTSFPLSPPSTPPTLTTELSPTSSGVGATLTSTPLDHKWFPHIVDHIISFSSLSTLRSFRATSRRYRDYVTPMLYAHAWVHSDPSGANGGLSVIDTCSPTNRLPVPLSTASLPLSPHTRTLDITGAYIPPDLLSFFSSPVAQLKTVRLRPEYGCVATTFPSADTLVLLRDAPFTRTIKPKGIRKVVHRNPGLAELAVINSFHREYEGVVSHVVFDFSAWEDDTATVPAPPRPRATTLAMLLTLLLARSIQYGALRRITIVGLDGVTPPWLGLPGRTCSTSTSAAATDAACPRTPATTTDMFKNCLMSDTSDVLSSIRDMLLGSDAADAFAGVEYLSRDEYAKTLTAEQLAVETVM